MTRPDAQTPNPTTASDADAANFSNREALEDTAGATGAVPGERGIPIVNRIRSVQSRVSAALTLTLFSVLAAGCLFWYVHRALQGASPAQQAAQRSQQRRVQGESSLPPLGLKAAHPAANPSVLERLLGPAPSAPEIPLATADPYTSAGPAPKSPAQLILERRMAGPVLTRMPMSAVSGAEAAGAVPVAAMGARSGALGEADADSDNLGALLRPTATPAVLARRLPTQRFLLPKGAFIDCTLETAINSSLPGMTTCITATDTFSADGEVVLLERGTKLVGETRGQVQQGSARLFVLWSEARTPTGVVVPLAFPGTDELGRSGLSGSIDRHWWQRFGAAILISVIDAAVQGVSGSRGNSVVVNPAQSSTVMTEVLKGTLGIAPTIDKPQGDRIQILVARDVDFRSVYALRTDAQVQ